MSVNHSTNGWNSVKIVEAVSSTPYVPYGAKFTVLTRCCLTSKPLDSTHVLVTCQVKFSERIQFEGENRILKLE